MLTQPSKKKTTALKNLQTMFEEYPVVTNESQKLKMDVIGQIEYDDSVVNDHVGRIWGAFKKIKHRTRT